MASSLKEEEIVSPPTCYFLTTTPLEIRLEIYKYLLVLDLQPPQNRSIHPSPKLTKQTLWFEAGGPINKTISTTKDKAPISTSLTTTANKIPNNANNWKPKRPPPLLHPSILSTTRQIYCEALPILYQNNTFLAHESNLTISPSLFLPPSPYLLSRSATPISVSVSPSIHSPRPNPNIYLIRRWRIRVRLDCGFPPWQSEDVTRAFSGAEELTLCVYRAMFIGGVGVDVLRRFEGVSGVRKVKILGCLTGFEGYARWLEGVMMRDPGAGEEEERGWEREYKHKHGDIDEKDKTNEVFMVGGYRCANELERKRLTGWVC